MYTSELSCWCADAAVTTIESIERAGLKLCDVTCRVSGWTKVGGAWLIWRVFYLCRIWSGFCTNSCRGVYDWSRWCNQCPVRDSSALLFVLQCRRSSCGRGDGPRRRPRCERWRPLIFLSRYEDESTRFLPLLTPSSVIFQAVRGVFKSNKSKK